MRDNVKRSVSEKLTRQYKGKMIKRVDARSANMWVFYFTDGTRLGLETEAVGGGIYGFQVVPEKDMVKS